MMRFAGKVVVITGGASGIGRAAAIRFAEEGATVFVADIDIDRATGVADAIGSVAYPVAVDVAFFNAGYLGPMDGFEATDEALFDRLLAVNLKGPFLGLKAVHPVIADGGAVVVTASTAWLLGLHESPGYTASKHGVIGIVKACSPAFAARGARINAICPGGVDTPMMGGRDTAIVPENALPRVPMRGTGSAHVVDAGLLATFTPAPIGP